MKIPFRTTDRQLDATGPLTDIVFLLLIFFMLAGEIRPSDPVPVKPPHSEQAMAAPSQSAGLYITADNRLFWKNQPIGDDQLVGLLQNFQGKTLLVKADGQSMAPVLLKVLKQAREHQVKQVKLLTISG